MLPFWKGRSVEDCFEKDLALDVAEDMDKYIFTFMLEITYGIGHFTMDHTPVLSRGLDWIIQKTCARLDQLAPEEQKGEKALFYQSVITSLNAVIAFAERYAESAQDLAQKESDPDRKQELEQIARICKKVPRSPATIFHEAIQAVYFIHLVAQIETGGNSISLGRIDQILFPYYKADIASGRITKKRAQTLVSLLFLKVNEI
ncbi:MAG: hypothetical protein HUK40_03500 [Desulfobacter sp.]|nr:hypothetical protein [Desulfobacter sp.]